MKPPFIVLLFELEPRRLLIGLMVASIAVAMLDVVTVALLFPTFALLTHESGIAIPGSLHWLVDENPDANLLAYLAGAVVLSIVLKNFALVGTNALQTRFATRGATRLARRLARGYLFAPLEYHLKRQSSQYLRGLHDLPRLVYFRGVLSYFNLFAEIGGVCMIIVALALIEPLSVFSAISIFAGLLYVNYRVLGRYFHRWEQRSATLSKQVYGLAGQVFPSIKIVKAVNAEPQLTSRFQAIQARALSTEANRRFVQLSIRPVSEVIMLLAALIVVVITLWNKDRVIDGLPFAAAFAFGVFRMLPSFNRISIFSNELKAMTPLVAELRAELDALAPFETDHATKPHLRFLDSLELRGVHYHYHDVSRPALKGVDLTIRAGEVVGLAGPSGAGKSTLVDVLLGLLVPSEGEVLLDGAQPRHVAALPNVIGYVPQNSLLLNATLRENIVFGIPERDIDEQRLRDALEGASLTETVAALPKGLDTKVGDFGAALSGGQRQRVGIARALYGQPSLLILDEATSDLDHRTELEIGETINALRGRTTIVLVAHRLHLLQACDRIFFLRDGHVEYSGTYAELIERCAEFRELANIPINRDSGLETAEPT